jgi:Uma2 family endonuclease
MVFGLEMLEKETPMPIDALKRSFGGSEIYYPDSDGLPMADGDVHLEAIINLRHALETYYAEEPGVYVSGNLLIYYVEGDPSLSIDPDAFVVPGAGKRDRYNYLLWEEELVPVIAFEIVSETGWPRVLREKKDIYERLGIEEYVVFDPEEEFMTPRFQGFRLLEGRYQSIPLEPDGSLRSRTTGLTIQPEGRNLRLIDAATGERFRWPKEAREAQRRAEQQIAQHVAARRAAEEELAQLRAEIERLKASG